MKIFWITCLVIATTAKGASIFDWFLPTIENDDTSSGNGETPSANPQVIIDDAVDDDDLNEMKIQYHKNENLKTDDYYEDLLFGDYMEDYEEEDPNHDDESGDDSNDSKTGINFKSEELLPADGKGTHEEKEENGSGMLKQDNNLEIKEKKSEIKSLQDYISSLASLFTSGVETCDEWIKCQLKSENTSSRIFSSLPSCPCYCPISLDYHNEIFDKNIKKNFKWKYIENKHDKFHIYKPGAIKCIQSHLGPSGTSLATQQCCYDKWRQLITRGRSAGTPQLLSPEVNKELYYRLEILPWVVCKGDWTKYNIVRPPNNALKCYVNPTDREYEDEVKEAKDFK